MYMEIPSKECKKCGKVFLKTKDYSLRSFREKAKFCSKICSVQSNAEARRGITISDKLTQMARKMAENGNSIFEIAKAVGKTKSSAYRYCEDIFIKRKKELKERNKKIRSNYLKGYSSLKIAEDFSLHASGVRIICKGMMRTLNSGILRGEKNPAWRGGVSSLQDKIRKSDKYSAWRLSIFVRDNFTCPCGQVGRKLVADHIKPFALILQENKIKTFEEALVCEDLWDTNNGRTLCYSCHFKTDTYGWKTYFLLRNRQ